MSPLGAAAMVSGGAAGTTAILGTTLVLEGAVVIGGLMAATA